MDAELQKELLEKIGATQALLAEFAPRLRECISALQVEHGKFNKGNPIVFWSTRAIEAVASDIVSAVLEADRRLQQLKTRLEGALPEEDGVNPPPAPPENIFGPAHEATNHRGILRLL